jgi:integrase
MSETIVATRMEARDCPENAPSRDSRSLEIEQIRHFPRVVGEGPNAVSETDARSAPPTKLRNVDRRDREYLTPAEVERLYEAAKKYGRYGRRDALMIWVAFRHALRIGELCALRWSQVDFGSSAIHVKRLKGGVASTSPMDERTIRGLRYLQKRREGQYVFTNERGAPVSPTGARKTLARLSEGMFDLGPIHWHMLRHSTGYSLANRGVDVRMIQAHMGHAEIKHTVRYTALAPERLAGIWDRR